MIRKNALIIVMAAAFVLTGAQNARCQLTLAATNKIQIATNQPVRWTNMIAAGATLTRGNSRTFSRHAVAGFRRTVGTQ